MNNICIQPTFKEILDTVYPIGYIWLSLSDVNPSTLVGGVWEKIEDVFLLGSGKHALNSRGGVEEVTLSISQMPSHGHREKLPFHQDNSVTQGDGGILTVQSRWSYQGGTYNGNDMATDTNITGGSQPHTNMPPYLTVNMWVRKE